jgi:hypothetical protein
MRHIHLGTLKSVKAQFRIGCYHCKGKRQRSVVEDFQNGNAKEDRFESSANWFEQVYKCEKWRRDTTSH